MELCQSDLQILGHLPDLGSRKSLGGSKLIPFKNDGGHCSWGISNAADIIWYPSPDLCLDIILSRELYGQFLRPHGLVFALTYTVNCGTL